MKTTNRHKATITLVVVSAGFFFSYPFSDFLLGGLISSACGAAMIGGIADWFAVTALFRRPLGIPFRTALIPRNRERIFAALAHMVEKELLTGDNIRRSLAEYPLGRRFAPHLLEFGGSAEARQVLVRLLADILARLDPEQTGRILERALKKNIGAVPAAPLLADVIEWLMERGYDREIAAFAAAELTELAGHPKTRELLVDLLSQARRSYERGMVRRKIFDFLFNFSPEEIAALLQRLLLDTLAGMQNREHPAVNAASAWLARLCLALRTDAATQELVETWKNRCLRDARLQPVIAQAIENFRMGVAGEEWSARWGERLSGYLEVWLEERMREPSWCDKWDETIKEAIARWLENNHGAISGVVRSSLSVFDDRQLADWIEEKAGDDLQMIRINGSVVGGCVGMLIFAVFRLLNMYGQ